jgi:glucose-1-phosphate thymidylyltransferase
LEANRFVLEQIINPKESIISGNVDKHSEIIGKVIIEKGTIVNKSSVFGPSIIGKNTVIENSYICPFSSVSYDCEIKNSEVEYSIIMKQCRIIDVKSRIEQIILGKNVQITKGKCRPKTHYFIIGDQSSIRLI